MTAEPVLTKLVSLMDEFDDLEAPFELPVVLLVGGQKMSGYLVNAQVWHAEVERLIEGKSRDLAEARTSAEPPARAAKHTPTRGDHAIGVLKVQSQHWRQSWVELHHSILDLS